MRLIKVAAGVLNQTPLDWEGNRGNVLAAVAAARREGVAVLCLPELCITGYGCEDAFLSPAVEETAWRVLAEILPETTGLVVSLGLPVRYRHALYNCACLVADGRLLGLTAKQYLAGDGLHYEPRWFKAWPAEVIVELDRGAQKVPLGDLSYEVGGVSIGFEICEDAWVATRPGSRLSRQGIDIILNPSASHFAFGKQAVRERYVLDGSRAFGLTYVYANPLGNEAGRTIYSGGALIATGGEMVAVGPRFSFEPWWLTSVVVDLDEARLRQARLTSHQPDLTDASHRQVQHEVDLPPGEEITTAIDRPDWEGGEYLKEEEFSRAVALGLFDYLRKSRSQGFVVSLSGGADSTAVAVLVWLMVELAWSELGGERFRQRLGHIPAIRAATDKPAAVAAVLHCVYQSTRNSSETTREAAREVAEAVGARFFDLDVDPLAEGYRRLLEEAIGRELTWERDDVTLQNVQARVRAPSAWMLANIEDALLLATSNRSEAAVGYATMDGDTAGGLSPIAGIDKAFLLRWLRWMESTGPLGVGPLPALAMVTSQPPTAELRPLDRHQTDERDLMPYELLDAIEEAAIGDKKSPLETYRLMRARFPGYGAADLLGWLERFFRLWSRNQWKRERYAPSFHVDDRNLDPKTWCRFPILSGGFDRELDELRATVAAEVGAPAS